MNEHAQDATDKGRSRGETATLDGTLSLFFSFFFNSRPVVATQMLAFAFGGNGSRALIHGRVCGSHTPLYFLPDAKRSGASATCVRINSRERSPCKSRRPGPCAAFKPGIKCTSGNARASLRRASY